MSWFSTGYDAVEKRSKELEEQQNKNYLPAFFLKEDESATIIFLTDEPINYYHHYVKSLKRYFTCSQDGNCPLCDTGNKPSYVGAYLVLDTRYEEWEKDSQKYSRQNTVKIMKHGIKALKQLKKHNEKRGLKNFAWEIDRTGSGSQDTTYAFTPVPLDDVANGIKLPTPEEIKELKEKMIESIKPKDRNALLDILAGRSPQNNQPTTQAPSSTPSSFTSDLDSDDDDVPIFKFM